VGQTILGQGSVAAKDIAFSIISSAEEWIRGNLLPSARLWKVVIFT
jgi:hypothetical protein